MIPNRYFWPVFAALMGFVLGGSVVWGLSYVPLQQHSARDQPSNEHSAEKDPKNGFWEKAADDPVAYFTLWLVGFTGLLAASTLGLWIATVYLYRGGERAIRVQRGIGMAQVRAYVSVKSATIDFMGDNGMPFIEIVVANNGQSPALGFVWTPTITYLADVPDVDIVYHDSSDEWAEQPGVDISPGAEHKMMLSAADFPLVDEILKHRDCRRISGCPFGLIFNSSMFSRITSSILPALLAWWNGVHRLEMPNGTLWPTVSGLAVNSGRLRRVSCGWVLPLLAEKRGVTPSSDDGGEQDRELRYSASIAGNPF